MERRVAQLPEDSSPMRLRMTWRGQHPTVKCLHGDYPDGVRVPAKEMKEVEARLQRSETLPKYDITIKPRNIERQVN